MLQQLEALRDSVGRMPEGAWLDHVSERLEGQQEAVAALQDGTKAQAKAAEAALQKLEQQVTARCVRNQLRARRDG